MLFNILAIFGLTLSSELVDELAFPVEHNMLLMLHCFLLIAPVSLRQLGKNTYHFCCKDLASLLLLNYKQFILFVQNFIGGVCQSSFLTSVDLSKSTSS